MKFAIEIFNIIFLQLNQFSTIRSVPQGLFHFKPCLKNKYYNTNQCTSLLKHQASIVWFSRLVDQMTKPIGNMLRLKCFPVK